MKDSIKLFDFMNTPVYLKYWFFILFLLLNFDINMFGSVFVAILVHEMAHTYVAKKLKHPVESITIGLFTGSAGVDTTYLNYKDTILITVAGPLSNLILAGIGYYIGHNIALPYFLESLVYNFWYVNLILFIFNILPIFPMDGGRISKAILQWITKPSIGRKINGYIGISVSVLLLILSIATGAILMAIFSLLFIYINYKEITQLY